MTRVLEFITALLIVAVLAVVVGVLMPSSGHLDRTSMISKDIRDVYDVFNNFGRFKDYSVLRSFDPSLQYDLSGKPYGPGAVVSWDSKVPKVGKGRLEIVSAKPGYAEVSDAGAAEIVWKVENDWPGHDKRFTIDMARGGLGNRLVKVTWNYDVKYGWNLLDRYSNLFIHGNPDEMVQYSLDNVQTMLAAVPNVLYKNLNPKLVDTPQQPVLFVATHAKNNSDDIDNAKATAMEKIQAAMQKLGVSPAGPRIVFNDSYSSDGYHFDVAVPINAASLKIDGNDYPLTAPVAPSLAPAAASSAPAAPASVAAAASTATPAGTAAVDAGPKPGTRDDYGNLVVSKDVRGMLAFGGRALMTTVHGSPNDIRPSWLMLEAYAATHGYATDTVNRREYDKQLVAYESLKPDGTPVMYDEQTFSVYLPVSNAPAATPEQEAAEAASAAAAAASAPAAASSAPAASSSMAPAEAASAD